MLSLHGPRPFGFAMSREPRDVGGVGAWVRAAAGTAKIEYVVADSLFAFGTEVECNYQSTGKWYKGKIMGIREGGDTFDILYDDGDGESDVGKDRIRAVGGAEDQAAENPAPQAAASNNNPAADVPVANKSGYEVGQTIQVRNGKDWKSGQLTEIDEELGSCSVQYSNGEHAKGVPMQIIRKFQAITKEKKKKKKKSGKTMNECIEVLSKFNESELDAALKMLQALDSVRAVGAQ